MKNNRRKNNYIIVGLCLILVIMAGGYAAFSSQLKISGTSKISSNWDIEITNITSKNIVGSASNKEEPTYTSTTATFSTNLVSPGDSITYDVQIENKGTIDGVLKLVDKTDTTNSAINFDTSGVKQGDVLKAGESTTYTIVVSYNNSVTSQPDNLSSTLKVTFDYIQNDGNDYSIVENGPVMMASDYSKAFWQFNYRYNISTIDILTTNDVPSNAVQSWDVSEAQDGSVMAYIVDDSSNSGMYKLNIGGEGGVIAPADSSSLFSSFSRLKSMNLSNLDTSNVTNMSRMLSQTSGINNELELTEIKGLENFDTSKVTDMSSMFFGQNTLTSIDVSSFDTSNVTTMESMFRQNHYNLTYLIEINMCGFNTSNVTDMSSMFYGTSKLTQIKVGTNWTTANATTNDMFTGSGVSEVTTGQC